ncbi:hypothetical protein M758_1G001300 [Ceratodon purpureus]|uniref:Triosephosphate isomerase n=1 Tax=Ceratodon purpureus TaxID=3225 RepID=A0A8T0J0Y5_CERPU|nr:hypothetical protein KC19_1G002400 [Ceratodon purpureus]KAG0589188.1 hypothetical protein KC19_1G002400 [Ceratodon purpureus]KAG0589189.1 hypothetical protein KC19_1G002400 [Ceratodon purpureus]KAG0628110.1 hypothetical protein M758_1G001300 [Ceratodon purpureus]
MSNRTFFVGGNWKCNGTRESIKKLVEELNFATIEKDCEVVVAPPYLYISQVRKTLKDEIQVAAQNSWYNKGGAFTGEISPDMLKDVGVKWVIQGHSERRSIIGESDSMIAKKSQYCLSQGLGVMACIGESLAERDANKTTEVCFNQLSGYLAEVKDWKNVVVAYEPVWAIGTGKVATPQQAQDVHLAIRGWLSDKLSPEIAAATRIIYGGSANASNCHELAKMPDIDGFLVGGAALKGPDFATICGACTSKRAGPAG